MVKRRNVCVRQTWVAVPFDKAAPVYKEVKELKNKAFKGLVLALRHSGWVEVVPAYPSATRGFRTRVRYTEALADWMVRKGLIFQYHPKGISRATALKSADLLRLKQNGKTKQLDRPLQDEELILPELNESLMKMRVDVPLTSYKQYTAAYDFSKGRPRAKLGGQKSVYRVFNEEDGRGGRLYGHWVQRLPKDLRSQLTINRQEAVELDYGGMQLALLYAQRGRSMPPAVDLYAVPGCRREDMKAVLVRSVGSDTREKALKALQHMLTTEGRYRTGRHEELYETFWNFHEGLCPHEEGNEAVWAELQYLDSKLALRVLASLLEKGIPAVPIHDSFIVKAKDEEATNTIMREEFSTMFDGAEVSVKRA